MTVATRESTFADSQRQATEETIARVLLEESEAIAAFAARSSTCAQAVQMIASSSSTLIVAGIGKSGHIARKIASTFTSLGKPAMFLHAAEASHGDLGLLQPGSVVLVLSNSGETPELSDLLHYCKSHDMPLVALTGAADSALARAATLAIVYGIQPEACANGLAPTTSTTLTLAIGDALAVAVSQRLGTAPEDFRRYHPGGKLGARLTTVGEVMRTGAALPLVDADATMGEIMVTMSEKAMGIAVLMRDGAVEGVITDGDLRRNMARLWSVSPRDIATKAPASVAPDMLLSDAAELMTEKEVLACLVGEAGQRIQGIVNVHDLQRPRTDSEKIDRTV